MKPEGCPEKGNFLLPDCQQSLACWATSARAARIHKQLKRGRHRAPAARFVFRHVATGTMPVQPQDSPLGAFQLDEVPGQSAAAASRDRELASGEPRERCGRSPNSPANPASGQTGSRHSSLSRREPERPNGVHTVHIVDVVTTGKGKTTIRSSRRTPVTSATGSCR